MAYETSLLFNLMAQRRAQNAQNKQLQQGYQAQMMRDVGGALDRQRGDEEAQIAQAAQFGALAEDVGQKLPDFNAKFSPQTETRLREAAGLGALAQIGARIKAQRAAEAAQEAERRKQTAITARETGIANIRTGGQLGAAGISANARIRAAEIAAGRPFAPRGGSARDPAKFQQDAMMADHWSKVAVAAAGGLASNAQASAIQRIADLYTQAYGLEDEAQATVLRAQAERMKLALGRSIDPETAIALERAASGEQ